MRILFWLTSLLLLECCAAWPQDVAALYVTNCANCHGADGRGNTPLGRALKLSNLRSSAVQDLPEADRVAVIGKGAGGGKMPGFQKKLGPDAVRQLADYVHSMNQLPEPLTVKGPSAKAKPIASDMTSVYSTRCANCHGLDGGGDTVLGRAIKPPDLRSLEAQKLSDSDLTAIIAHGAGQGRMPAFQKKLGAEIVQQLVPYVRELSGRAPGQKADLASEAETGTKETSTPDKSINPASAIPISTPEPASHATANQVVESGGPEVQQVQNPGAIQTADVPPEHPPDGPKAGQLVDLNSASKETLMALPGLTEQDALNIIRGRPYKSTLQFKVKGVIAPGLYGRIANRIIARRASKNGH